mgnify:CR=1 FL=1
MNDIIMYGSALIAVIIVVIMLIKKMDIKVTLFAMGIVLMYIAIAMGNPIAIKEFEFNRSYRTGSAEGCNRSIQEYTSGCRLHHSDSGRLFRLYDEHRCQ